jgi:nijmegen breakage syndrome protein 1
MASTIWIVDGSYMFKGTEKFLPEKIDYIRLKHHLEGTLGDSFYETYFLDSVGDPPHEAEERFHTFLKLAPPDGPQMRVQLYGLKTMDVECPDHHHCIERKVQKGVDVGIATLIIKLATQGKYDRLVLSAGDGDFEDAIDYVKSDLGKEVVICGFKFTVSPDLQSYADRVVWLDEIWDEVKKPSRKARSA